MKSVKELIKAGNRVAAISYGPSKIYLVVGANKVTKDCETAFS